MKALHVKYRPQTFEEVLGADITTGILKRQIEINNLKNAYLFSGATGTGKTSTAYIFTKELDGELIEIDAASNNGVENIRNLVDDANRSSITNKYKVYIIDECHMLTNAAWQPLLKILEAMPVYTIFIFCTTDVQKVPSTILNRVQRFNFKPLHPGLIRSRLEYVCNQEGYVNYEESIDYISKVSNGCMRDALSQLDKVTDYSENLDIKVTQEILGICPYTVYFGLTNALIDHNEGDTLNIIDSAYNEGMDLKVFVDEYFKFVLDLYLYLGLEPSGRAIECIDIPSYLEEDIKYVVDIEGINVFYNMALDKLLALKNMLKNEVDVKSVVEVVCLQIARYKSSANQD